MCTAHHKRWFLVSKDSFSRVSFYCEGSVIKRLQKLVDLLWMIRVGILPLETRKKETASEALV